MSEGPKETSQRPLELILARNLLTSLSTPAFLLGETAELLFYNESAGAMLGVSFEDAGRMPAEDWITNFGPYDSDGNPIPLDELSLTQAIRDGRPGHSDFTIKNGSGDSHRIAASALPIIGNEAGATGAMVIFWPVDPDAARDLTAEHLVAKGDG